MKRSEYIAIGAIGILMAATIWPRSDPTRDSVIDATPSGSGFTTLAFASVDECRQSQAVTEQVCSTEWGKAQQSTVADAPKYEQLADCEAEYGASQCRPATWNGASVFIPALAGVLIARNLAGAAASSQPLYPPRVGPQSCPSGVSLTERPECQSRSGSGSGSSSSSSGRSYYSTGSGRVIGRVAGAVLADVFIPSRTTVSRTTVAPRGGSFSGTPSNWSSPSTTSSSRPSGSFSQSSSPTASRGGFGSSGSSFSSSSS
jgi:uncharacterized protein YgiB involved in biofilm formation